MSGHRPFSEIRRGKPHIRIEQGGRRRARVFLDGVEVRGLRSVIHNKSLHDAEFVTLEVVAGDSVEFVPFTPEEALESVLDDEFECQLCGMIVRRPFLRASECQAWPSARMAADAGYGARFHQWNPKP